MDTAATRVDTYRYAFPLPAARPTHDARRRRPAGRRFVAPVGGGVAGDGEVPLQVHAHHGVPLVLGHVGEHAVAHEPGVVDHRVEPTEGVDGRAHQGGRILDSGDVTPRSEEHTSELQSLMRMSYSVFCLKNKKLLPTHLILL